VIAGLTGVQPADAGVASGLLNTSRQIGGAIGLAAVTTIASTAAGHYADSQAVLASSGPAPTQGFHEDPRHRRHRPSRVGWSAST
jgi:hypothetical protein